jgi:hypothetical protein
MWRYLVNFSGVISWAKASSKGLRDNMGERVCANSYDQFYKGKERKEEALGD